MPEARAPALPDPRNLTIERAVVSIASSRVKSLHQVGDGISVAVKCLVSLFSQLGHLGNIKRDVWPNLIQMLKFFRQSQEHFRCRKARDDVG